MLKLLKFLKPSALAMIAIVGLLLFQAICDLSLPDYMSNIVNEGIQQGGIKDPLPEAIRKTSADKLFLFMSAEEQKTFTDNYRLLEVQNLSSEDANKLTKDYPALKNEPVYKLNTSDKSRKNELIDLLKKPIMVTVFITQYGLKGPDGEPAELPEGTDPFMAIAQMPAEQRAAMLTGINEQLKNMQDILVKQSAIAFIKQEYVSLGINTDKLQSNYILMAGLVMLLLALASMAATVIVVYLAARVAARMGKDVRNNLFRSVESFSSAEFDKFSTASLITRSTNDIQQIQIMMVMLLRIIFYAPILCVGGIIKVLAHKTAMGWIIAVAVAAIMSIVLILFSFAIPRFKLIQKLVDKLNLVTRESLIGMLVIRAFNTQKHEEKRFDKANTELTNTNLFVSQLMSLMMPLMMFLMNGIMLLIVWVGAHHINDGIMQVGDMMAFMQYAMQIIMSFLMFTFVSIMLPRATVAAGRIHEVLNTKPSIYDAEKSKGFDPNKHGEIEFKNVSFRYPGALDDALSNISFTTRPGQTTAIIGSTGSGKSTLVNLIPRFYDVTEGQIIIDGVDVREVTQHDLREKIGYVPQKSFLFSGTIGSNLKFGDENACPETLTEAAQTAQVYNFISENADGFETAIAQGGTNVSGGQKQRLSIARALVKKADIYIFDDSFSALDFKTDAALRKALKEQVSNSAVLIVAQRINTIMHADQIMVLEDGQIVGRGTHEELMQTCGVYQEIALSQLSKEELVS